MAKPSKSRMVLTRAEVQKELEKTEAGLYGILCRVVDVFGVPCTVQDGEAPFETKMRGLREFLAKEQHGYSMKEMLNPKPKPKKDNVVNGVEVPFG